MLDPVRGKNIKLKCDHAVTLLIISELSKLSNKDHIKLDPVRMKNILKCNHTVILLIISEGIFQHPQLSGAT